MFNLKGIVVGLLLSVFVFGLFAISVQAKESDKKLYKRYEQYLKYKNKSVKKAKRKYHRYKTKYNLKLATEKKRYKRNYKHYKLYKKHHKRYIYFAPLKKDYKIYKKYKKLKRKYKRYRRSKNYSGDKYYQGWLRCRENLEQCFGKKSSSEATLLFKSGFESGTYISSSIDPDNLDYRYIKGTDDSTGFTWPINILGASGSALHYIDDDNQVAVVSSIQTTTGHSGQSSKALYAQENYKTDVTQCPYEILNITKGRKDLYIRYWMKIDSTSITQLDKWRALFEWKTKDYASGNGFRLIAFIYTDSAGHPYWHWQGDADPMHPVWEIDNTTIPVQGDTWFLNEFYWHWSENGDGRALWKVNGQVVGDHYGPTTRNGKPIDFIMPWQIYGDANPKYQWIDDIEIWDKIPSQYQ